MKQNYLRAFGLELLNKALLTYMVKRKVLLVPFGWIWGSGMMLGHPTVEADDHSHPSFIFNN